ncbi:MAG: hypothetical protein CMK09_09215 [Ponticaulis sp.]|nr:hypothetical protein [Ponticaulis sp.]|tara:strand:- start:9752 stop:10138 length:387 start_codon:yes stop_codon:yes gene_type:complete
MLITPYSITRALLMLICAIGVFVFVFIWAMSGQSQMETCLYLGTTAAFAHAAIAPYTAGRWLGRMIVMVSFGATIYFPFFGVSLLDRPTLATIWPGLLLGAIMAMPVHVEQIVSLVLSGIRTVRRART